MGFLKSLIRSIIANLPGSAESVDASYLRNLPVPFLSQRKNTYVWKDDETEISMAPNSCNITCIAMVLHYFGVTEDTPDTMMKEYFKNKE